MCETHNQFEVTIFNWMTRQKIKKRLRMWFKLRNTCYVSCACTLNFHSILMHPQVSLTKFSCSEWAPSIMIDPVYNKTNVFDIDFLTSFIWVLIFGLFWCHRITIKWWNEESSSIFTSCWTFEMKFLIIPSPMLDQD